MDIFPELEGSDLDEDGIEIPPPEMTDGDYYDERSWHYDFMPDSPEYHFKVKFDAEGVDEDG